MLVKYRVEPGLRTRVEGAGYPLVYYDTPRDVHCSRASRSGAEQGAGAMNIKNRGKEQRKKS